jgi:transposase
MAMRAEKEKEAFTKMKDMLKDLTVCLESIGYINPLNKVYNLTKDLDYFPLVAALFTINILS